ncbi:hypothetical protein C9J12_25450 [Photobacterium frigidiphilum]|uniref:MarR family transcriptional regulator n=1 Tax=Photobacterium frigidiphilum TaxID=264736 RepID=A0A2T3J7W2_9GAMM|nr:hypothetical protein [Photobacterium frigidiphilum]PSU44843.1 hypothetical protein C9J12_25450 [Photobacterium frigidiphilum]
MTDFQNRVDILKEIATLPRQSVCFQLVTLLRWCDNGLNDASVETYKLGDDLYYSAKSLKSLLGISTKSNFHKGLYALFDAGLIERLVIDKSGEVVSHDNYQRNTAIIFWKLSAKGKLMK